MKKAALFLLSCLISVSTFAGEIPSKVLKGKVFDKSTHEALAGVKVSLDNSTQSVYTDLDGNFTLLISGRDKATVSFSTVSYNETRISVTDSYSDVKVQLEEL